MLDPSFNVPKESEAEMDINTLKQLLSDISWLEKPVDLFEFFTVAIFMCYFFEIGPVDNRKCFLWGKCLSVILVTANTVLIFQTNGASNRLSNIIAFAGFILCADIHQYFREKVRQAKNQTEPE